MPDKFSFNLAVRNIARERKWTIKKTAWFCGVPISTLQQLMESKHTYISTIEKYAAKFNMTTIVFIEKGQQEITTSEKTSKAIIRPVTRQSGGTCNAHEK
ncbi:hypothetical protein [Pantoea sp.]|uniref:hypothetical protein n=1 Tax=Pantoea sp. TaxID=69393 RepID=UPI0028A68724|nr:hypothetical protein [Pantoea sp.]